MASLACTSCRAKKQRCDRMMPSCMQCINAQQPCRYPDQHKRGLPAGFLNAVESRLRETEDALFYALRELHEGTVEDRAYAGLSHSRAASSQNKSEMMEKWAKLPLGDRAQAKAWFLSQRRSGDGELLSSSSSSPTNDELAAPQSGVQIQQQQSSSSPSGIKTAQSGSGGQGGDMTPLSPREASPLLDSMAVPAFHPRSHGWVTLAEKSTAAAPSLTATTSAPDGRGLSTRVKAIAESRKRMYF